MKRFYWVLIGIGTLLVGLGSSFFLVERAPESEKEMFALESAPSPSMSPEPKEFDTALRSIRLAKIKEVKEELARSPQSSPDCLHRSKEDLNEAFQLVHHDQDAKQLLQVFSKCIQKTAVYPLSLRLECIVLTRKLAKKHTALRNEVFDLLKDASFEVQSVSQNSR